MKNILIGHAQNERTGVTVILAPEGATGGVDVRGGAPGTRETDLLKSENSVQKINAVVLSGGSAFGLESACGVMDYLYERGHGFNAGVQKVPIVCGAVLFDLMGGAVVYPDKQMGYSACLNAVESGAKSGLVGAGKGATTGKLLAPRGVDRGGVGVVECSIGEVQITAVVAVNAVGDVVDPGTGAFASGLRGENRQFLDSKKLILSGFKFDGKNGTNTTIGCVCVNAKLTKAEANKLAQAAHDGLARCIQPVHTMADGDTVFVMATGEVSCDFNQLCVAAVEAVSRAIIKAVTA